ncbi:MAG: TCR/Tet family MFS transporter [Pseudomonadota bacterium]
MDTPPDSPKAPGRTLLFVFITVLLSMVGFGIIMPIMPSLMMDVTGQTLSEATTYGGILYGVYALAQFIMSPVMGGLSDRYGRRPVLLVSLFFYAVDFLLLALAPTYAWLVFARFLSGATSATFSTANAVIADVSPPEKRSANFGLMGAAFGLGFIIGPVMGGLFAEIDIRAPFYAAAALGFANFVFGYFAFPETSTSKRDFSWKRANPFGTLVSVSRHGLVPVVLVTYFLIQFAYNALPAVFSYFAQLKYDWSALDIGIALAFVGIVSAGVQGGLTRKIIPAIGEQRSVLLGAATMVVSFIGYGFFSPSGGYIYLWVAVGALGGLMVPAMQGIMSAAVPSDSQGELQGAVASVMSLTMLTSPIIMTRTFTLYTDSEGIYFPGAPMLLSCICLVIAMIPFAIVTTRKKAEAQASPGVSA